MPLQPDDWSVVVIGYWNRAILTPAGIARELFDLPADTPVQVYVPLDTIAPHKVRHQDVEVIAASDRLIVKPVNNTIENMGEAMRIAKKALSNLPRTPVSAAGMNLRYRSETPVETLSQISTHDLDNRLSDDGIEIESRGLTRSVKWGAGRIQVFVEQEAEGKYELLLNFESQSKESSVLEAWVSQPVEEIRAKAKRLLYNVIGLSEEELSHV